LLGCHFELEQIGTHRGQVKFFLPPQETILNFHIEYHTKLWENRRQPVQPVEDGHAPTLQQILESVREL